MLLFFCRTLVHGLQTSTQRPQIQVILSPIVVFSILACSLPHDLQSLCGAPVWWRVSNLQPLARQRGLGLVD